jgi:hypothetical protein
VGRRPGAAGIARRRGSGGRQQEEDERKGEEGRLTGGPRLSAAQGKRKRRGERWAGAGGRLVGRLGCLG